MITRLARLAAAAGLSLGVLTLGVPSANAAADPQPIDVTSGREAYPGDPKSESALVASEDDRLVEVQTVDSLAKLSEVKLTEPYRLATGSAYTLVLTPRSQAYTVADLLRLAPQTFLRRPDGSYLLTEHVVVLAGATLNLSNAGGLDLKLASDKQSFVSIVNFGGRLNLLGTKGSPTTVTSFDRDSARPDETTEDGRAYLRSVGGQVMLRDVEVSHLGFWSGRTGGLSLTGTDRPNSGQLDKLGGTLDLTKAKRIARKQQAEKAAPTPQEALGDVARQDLSEVLPSGSLPVPTVDVDTPQYSFVSASLMRTKIDGNAFGLFVSSANGLDVRDSRIENSLVDGMVMHRFVTNAVVENTLSQSNGGDGFSLARATTGIVLSEIRAIANGRNGVTMSGLPLATGPSATGISVGSYGNNAISNSNLSDNGRYGVEVVGGVNIGVLANTMSGDDMGVVVREGARKVSVVGNRIQDAARHGISIRDSVTDATVSGNIVEGGETSTYVRDSEAQVRRNTLTNASHHAVALVGAVGQTLLTGNTIAGKGPSAVDAKRAGDLDRSGWNNDTSGWEDTTPFLVTLKKYAQPLTLLWIVLAALLLYTAVRGARTPRVHRHPYHDKHGVGGEVRGREELLDPVS